MAKLTEVASFKCFGGQQKIFTHDSAEVKSSMNFAVFLPPQAEQGKVPVIYWLSGLTCTERNFIEKAGAQRYAAEHGVAIVCPDTSPRNCSIEGEDEDWTFGTGASFYVDATEDKWKNNYRMFSYVNDELQSLVLDNFPVMPDKVSIFGHSMGGHGALISALKNPGKYRSVSALAPVCNPSSSPWGRKCFSGYLGPNNLDQWKEYDATCLVRNYQGPPMEILIDQGKDDEYLADGQLCPNAFVEACTRNEMPIIYRLQEGYEHGYYFVATFIEDHIKHHLKYLSL